MSKKQKKDSVKELAQEIDVFDHMLSALVEVLEEKGIITQEEWERKIKAKIDKTKTIYRDIESEE
jgi:DNA-binding HxlR family transcriptional regulator